jgi:hypothetical protein
MTCPGLKAELPVDWSPPAVLQATGTVRSVAEVGTAPVPSS